MNVLKQIANHSCVICYVDYNTHRLSIECRVKVFVLTNIYVPSNVRSCAHHLDEKGFFLQVLLPGLQSINRPYVIRGEELQIFLQQLRNMAINQERYEDENCFSNNEFQSITPITKEQFRELFTFCDRVPHTGGYRYVTKKDLLTFLCKLRQGLLDEFLKVIFNYSSRQAVSLTIATVRKSLMQQFVPNNIGFKAITRQDYIARHVTEFANALYNPNSNVPKAIAYIDGTYSYVPKSNNFRVLRQSYCVHKGRHLVKPALVVAPDGYILAIQGPYFSDSRNNDAEMLRNEYERDVDSIRKWFQDHDIFIVDRGYRDPWLYHGLNT